MARKTAPSKGAFGWETAAYANFKTWQKVIFWLWPLAILNYVFIVYWFIVFLSNRKKPLQDRRETYVKALYYYDIFWLCLVAAAIAFIAYMAAGPEAEPCASFYCESQTQFGNDDRCENPAYVLGDDGYCYPPCGSTTSYCVDDNSYCYRNECVTCPAGTELYKDGKCYEPA